MRKSGTMLSEYPYYKYWSAEIAYIIYIQIHLGYILNFTLVVFFQCDIIIINKNCTIIFLLDDSVL